MAVEQLAPTHETEQFDRELRTRTDAETWLAETLHGSMRSSFEFQYDGAELRGEDGGALDEIFDDAIRAARVIAQKEPRLMFELRRRIIEREELEDMYRLAADELPGGANTMVVVSDYPPELMGSNEHIGGYNGDRKQTMLRVVTRQIDGSLRMVTQSLDGSNRQALHALYNAVGDQPEAGELLEQRRYLTLTSDEQEQLPDNLRDVYDSSLERQHGGAWHAGIEKDPQLPEINTLDFVRTQHDLIDWFSQLKLNDPAEAEKQRYNLTATMTARFKRYQRQLTKTSLNQTEYQNYQVVQPDRIADALYHQDLYSELQHEGASASRRGDVFSGCGGSIGPGESVLEGQLGEAGYGNKSQVGTDKFGSLQFECPKGHKNIRPRNQLIECCKTCGVSVKC